MHTYVLFYVEIRNKYVPTYRSPYTYICMDTKANKKNKDGFNNFFLEITQKT
jgi:hypothetical protein